MTDEIAKSLGLEPISKPSIEGEIVKREPQPLEEGHDDTDYEYARDNFYNVIEKGNEALEEMMMLAKSSEHPRAFEVVSTLMKTIIDANKDLVKMNEERKKGKTVGSEATTEVTNNNLFVGSTSELQKMLKGEIEDD